MTSPGYIFNVGKSIIIFERTFPIICSGKAKPRISSKLPQEILEIVRVERYVTIQIPNQVVFRMAGSCQPRVEGVHLAGEVALVPFGHSHQLDPIMGGHISLDNLVGPVC